MRHKVIRFFIFCLILNTAYAAESYDVKTFRVITKLCGMCHGTPFYMAKQKDDDTWAEYFEEKETLLKIHKNDAEAMENLQSKRFKNNREDILKFFIQNSKYAGKVHGCDANFCGTHH